VRGRHRPVHSVAALQRRDEQRRHGAAADDGAKKEALTALDDLYRAEVPAFPLMYRPDEFFEFNASNWSNWPAEDNDYAPPMFRGAGNEWIFKLKKIGG